MVSTKLLQQLWKLEGKCPSYWGWWCVPLSFATRLYEKQIGRICLLSTTVGLTLSTSSYRMEVGKSQVQHRPVRPVLAIFSKVLCVGLPAPSCAL